MNALGCSPAHAVGPVTTVRRRLAMRGRWVEVEIARVEGGSSLSVAGARLAERLVARLLELPPRTIRVAPLPPSGRPVVLHDGAGLDCGVSISHLLPRHPSPTVGVVAAAACRGGGIGLDLVAPADIAPASIASFLSPDERAMAGDAHGAALVWAAKEAAFKAAGLDEGFRPRRVVVERLTPRGFAWRVRGDFREVHGTGDFLPADDHVLAIAFAARNPDRIADNGTHGSRLFEECHPTP